MHLSYSGAAREISALLLEDSGNYIPIQAAGATDLANNFADHVSGAQANWLAQTGWVAKPGAHAILPGEDGIDRILFAYADKTGTPAAALQAGALPAALPEGTYKFINEFGKPDDIALAWLLGAYAFKRYQNGEPKKPRRLVLPKGADRNSVIARAQAIWFARELINLPANDLCPAELGAALADMGNEFGAVTEIISGDDLLTRNFPMIHAVGRASDRAPCLADLVWGDPSHPKLTLVGKGICFDTGGLNIKPGPAMALMKKDMGGAASVIALGAMIMAAKLPVRLRILIPAADNSISSNAFRPGDILRSRSGITVEIANTDAEGRLVLADALSLADEEAPDFLIDMATLTGAARVALGPDLPPFYTDNDRLASDLQSAGMAVSDPLWRLPFWEPYDAYLKSEVADVNHIYDSPYAGSITAALFLKRFVSKAKRYAHFDIFGWVPKAVPGKPTGGEPQGARALFDVIQKTYGKAASNES